MCVCVQFVFHKIASVCVLACVCTCTCVRRVKVIYCKFQHSRDSNKQAFQKMTKLWLWSVSEGGSLYACKGMLTNCKTFTVKYVGRAQRILPLLHLKLVRTHSHKVPQINKWCWFWHTLNSEYRDFSIYLKCFKQNKTHYLQI